MKWRTACLLIGLFCGIGLGIACGCVIGYYAAHHFPFYGGFAVTFGEPFSPARSKLVPGHMLLCSVVLSLLMSFACGVVGYLIGWAFDKN